MLFLHSFYCSCMRGREKALDVQSQNSYKVGPLYSGHLGSVFSCPDYRGVLISGFMYFGSVVSQCTKLLLIGGTKELT